MKKRKISTWYAFALIVTIVFLGLLPQTVHADTGPKPSIDLEVTGAPDDYYIALLGKKKYGQRGENSQLKVDAVTEQKVEDYLKDFQYDGWEFYESPLGDNLFRRNETGEYRFWYRVPNPFRVILIDMNGEVHLSDVLHQWEYNAECAFDFSTGALIEHNAGAIVKRILVILGSYVITLVIELLVLNGFYPRKKKNLLCFLLANTVTNIPLNVYLLHSHLGFELLFVWILLELLVVFVEGCIYSFGMTDDKGKKSEGKAFCYSALANFLSALAGILIQLIYYSFS